MQNFTSDRNEGEKAKRAPLIVFILNIITLTFQVFVASVCRMSCVHSNRPRCHCDQLPPTRRSSSPRRPQPYGSPEPSESCVSSWNRAEKEKQAQRLQRSMELDTSTAHETLSVPWESWEQTNNRAQHICLYLDRKNRYNSGLLYLMHPGSDGYPKFLV